METFSIHGLTFAYPEMTKEALSDISFSVPEGQFVCLVGPSGCGKSTLLRHLKTVLSPHGMCEGEILFEGQSLAEVDQRTQSSKIGFVHQSPENQIVTDKVWHELAFGLESLGFSTPEIRGRVAEMASFFGIQNWFYKNVAELSGGQKQTLNLASIMALQPSVLILDEPTSQLDPIAASDFLATVGKINRELGTTIIMTEHRLEEVFPMADRIIAMEEGKIIADGEPREVGLKLKSGGSGMFYAMPTPMRVWAGIESDKKCPLTVREGRDFMEDFAADHEIGKVPPAADAVESSAGDGEQETAISLSDIWFKYEKDGPDIVKGLSCDLKKGEFFAVLGGNGTGKTTSLSVIGGLRKAYRGERVINGQVGILPQNPQTLFVKKTIKEDLYEIFAGTKVPKEERDRKVARVVKLCRLEELIERHPYDVSGGEQQRAALAKVLLLAPEILLMDEPTKGLDAEFKKVFAEILRSLKSQGVTVFMVSHDVEFCAEYADRCALFFDGNIVTESSPREFFSGNSFYTTAANRMARNVIEDAVTARDIIVACGGKAEPPLEIPEGEALFDEVERLNKPDPGRLPLWRKGLAAVSAIAAVYGIVRALQVTDLSSIINETGGSGVTPEMWVTYIILIVSLIVLAFCVSKKSEVPPEILQMSKEKRKLSKRTIAATIIVLLLIPITIFIGTYYLGGRKYYFISLLILLEVMLPFALVFEGRKPQARELIVIAVLCALGIAGRAAFFMLPEFKPVMAIVIISAVAFGGEAGFLIGAMTMLLSNMMFGQGPWTPWQMFTMGLVGFLAGVLYRKGLLRRSRASLVVFGAFAATVVYGGIMNPASALMWLGEINSKIIISYYITGIPVDLVRAVATAVFLWFGAEPMLEKLDRIKVKYGLVS